MAHSKGLPRLLRLRKLEEEQSRVELDAAVGLRNRASDRVMRARQTQSQSRSAFATAIQEYDLTARSCATLELGETLAQRLQAEARLAAAEAEVENHRDTFLLKRMDREQVETLVEKQAVLAREQTNRRAQQMLDDWYGRKAPKGVTDARSGLDESPPMKFS